MTIFTAEIAGQRIIVFAALDQVRALAFVNDDFLLSELRNLRTTDGNPLWAPGTDLTVRPAKADECALWERNLTDDIAAGVHESRKDAVASNGFSFLVEYLEPDE